ncbi:23S rRNA (adenine(2030)-N(6))-methyltransferase RlmJ [Niveibacterium terrae]|uniref:23S rRNA (adenine(2030)-N(6))-methyltransferase RlmJ n=1 Tax=Niveibacterium terrae TaxID=3373598 RepID=UPI003A8EAA90
MLSYRHAFHAGNHADVLKHLILVQLIRYLGQKEKPFWIIDTHAGAGAYSLEEGYATRLGEFQHGVGRLWERSDLPAAVRDYVEQVRVLNGDGALRLYPGSPWIASQLLRPQDKLRLFELHSTDGELLAENFSDLHRQVQVTLGDGFKGLKALLPPPPRRALVLIDPSYETTSDYSGVVSALEDALRRFPTGTYALWYPLLSRPESRRLPELLKALPAGKWIDATLSVEAARGVGPGMHGSGMFIINPPWTLEATLRETLPWLSEVLAQQQGAHFTLDARSDS